MADRATHGDRSLSRRTVLGGLGAGGLTSLSGCIGLFTGGGAVPDGAGSDDTIVTFWERFGGGDGEALEGIVESYNEDASGTFIDRQRIPPDDHYDRLYTSFTGGDAPDLTITHGSVLGQYNDYFMDLSDEFADLEDEYTEAIWESGQYDDEQLGIPMDAHPQGMYYNKDLFEEAGLDPEDPPDGYDEFADACDAIVENTDAYAFRSAIIDSEFFMFLRQYGGQMINEDNTAVRYDEEAGIKAAEFLYEIGERGWDHTDMAAGLDGWRGGNVAMVYEGTWAYPVAAGAEFDWGYFKPNIAPDVEQVVTRADTHLVSVPVPELRHSSTSVETDAGIEFTRELTTEYIEEWALNGGHLPGSIAATESDTLREAESWKVQGPLQEMAADDALAYPPRTEFGDRWWEPLNENLGELYSHRMEPEEAIEDAAERSNRIIEEEREWTL
ncbi:extracellular solute-binding protein [Halostagnicola sp. A-GB9-2]|uniref:extracellular solute-binding protein n=1 Tax=Halostagnicola sp. A-GB9-2 TaxID=3048066 RepID=UPI0024BF7EFD|nr:extracellular solute-binding protein [Halostagnicola sp. A-GB9-2]MDJ1433662.1 extracellular solute-binding protein [Halostagnicola sp. A-GB9-2]